MAVMRRAVFLDKDGTLIDDVPYNVDPLRVRLAHGAGGALRALKDRGFLLIVVSNQPGVALARFSLQSLASVECRIQELLAASSVEIDAFYYCPHLPQAPNVRYAVRCLCRKPQPGLLRQAAREWQIDLAQSWLVGDILDDVEAGNRASCRTVLVDTGNETEWRLGLHRQPDHLAGSLRDAARLILATAGRAPRDPEGDGNAFGMASQA
ncbi:MAG TPA: HAD family hydrolase [Gammaproteobacteria bacterium]|jgi:D-glycero-D-manno-heptose 1,7-bisphosphate phosphatase|nr:HAD family hydrolase [Gammaproteobacteria bacterium]